MIRSIALWTTRDFSESIRLVKQCSYRSAAYSTIKGCLKVGTVGIVAYGVYSLGQQIFRKSITPPLCPDNLPPCPDKLNGFKCDDVYNHGPCCGITEIFTLCKLEKPFSYYEFPL